MGRTSGRFLFGILAVVCLLLAMEPTLAHRLDEYLQAAMVTIGPGSVEIDLSLTPGVAVVSNVLAAVDQDGDQTISTREERAYGSRILKDLTATMDGNALPIHIVEWKFPTLGEIREGLGTVHFRLEGALPRLRSGEHHFTLENRHFPEISQYLMNCLVPVSPLIQIHTQERNEAQSSYRVTSR